MTYVYKYLTSNIYLNSTELYTAFRESYGNIIL